MKLRIYILYIVASLATPVILQQSLPIKIPSLVTPNCSSSFSTTNLEVELHLVNSILNEKVGPPCACSDSGRWKRVAYLNMSDNNMQCPGNWSQIESPVRACIGRTSGCHSAFFSTDQFTYNHVCGRVLAYQKGNPDAFDFWSSTPKTVEGDYLDGVSLTYGTAGSRKHVWSFVAAVYETDDLYHPQATCACTNTNQNWPYQVPSFIGNNYFCDSGNPGPGHNGGSHYLDDTLWDGSGCGPDSSCCQQNNPPWFCTSLSQPTDDDLELRICKDEDGTEDIDVYLVEIYVASQ